MKNIIALLAVVLFSGVMSAYADIDQVSSGELITASGTNQMISAINTLNDTTIPAIDGTLTTLTGTTIPAINATLATKTSFARTLTVTAGTDSAVNGTNLENAISGITTNNLNPSAAAPILIQLEPGTYQLNQNLTLARFVSIKGAGITTLGAAAAHGPGLTTIDDSGHSFTLSGDNTLSDLAVINSSTTGDVLTVAPSGGSNGVVLNNIEINSAATTNSGIVFPSGAQAAAGLLLYANNLQIFVQNIAGPNPPPYAAIYDAGATGTAKFFNTTVINTAGPGRALVTQAGGTFNAYFYNSTLNTGTTPAVYNPATLASNVFLVTTGVTVSTVHVSCQLIYNSTPGGAGVSCGA